MKVSTHSPSPERPSSHRAFTLIELLAVIAVIGILASILIPLTGKVQENARKAKTRVQFSQWATAIEAFRQEYGYYPKFADNKVNGNQSDSKSIALFQEVLTGRPANGSTTFVNDSEKNLATAQNKKRIGFLSFGNDEVRSDGQVVDAFGNFDITVLVDSDYDGAIPPGDINATTAKVTPPTASVSPPSDKVPATVGVRAGVIFFSAGAGGGSSDVVTSW